MRPGSDELHPLPAQKVPPAKVSKDLDLEELAEHALIPGRQGMPDTVAVPAAGCYKRVQVGVKPCALAESLLGNYNRRAHIGSACALDEV